MRAQIFSCLYKLGAARMLRRGKAGQLTILSIHRVTDERDPFFQPLKPRAFDELLHHVKRHYTLVAMSEAMTLKKEMKKPPLVLSFDDGYYDFVEYAMPLLDKHRVGANHNIVNACAAGTAYIWTERFNNIFQHCRSNGIELSFEEEGMPFSAKQFDGNWPLFNLKVFLAMLALPRDQRLPIIDRKEAQYGIRLERRMMNWEEVRQCAGRGIEIGSHTWSHDVLATITDDALLRQETAGSKLDMEQQLGRPVDIIALPNGQGNPRVDSAAAAAGFKYLLYVDAKTNPLPLAGAGMQKLYRVGINDEPLAETALRIELFHSKMRF